MTAGLQKTRKGIFGRIGALLRASEVTDEFWNELEELLIQGDVGAETAEELLSDVRERARKERARDGAAVKAMLVDALASVVNVGGAPTGAPELQVILIVGVNGSGKTTTAAKLAYWYRRREHRVVLAAADTFRAAAIDQLKIWGQRAGIDVIAHQPGSDPGAVVFDAVQACQARGADLLLVDTAGRLHTKFNLMEELKKVRTVAARQVPGAPHQVLLVLDATTGQNGLSQARIFKDQVGVTGVVVAKLDGTARGGVVVAIAHELRLPVLFLGVGEGLEDLVRFEPREFARALVG
jgi:fused signal recognition particle receptor